QQVGDYFGVTEGAVRQAIKRGDLKAIRFGRRVLVTRASLEALEGQ
ncbi:MAG: helix-turn-helix domain-containing protein, partial [Acidimicrobiia bacterium]